MTPTPTRMALVELMLLYASFKATDFQRKPSPENLTDWCNATEVIDHNVRRNHERIAA